jgi:hypothetical protein
MPASFVPGSSLRYLILTWQIQQPLDSLQLTPKLRKGERSIRAPESALQHKRKPSGTRINYHSAFRFGMQLALFSQESSKSLP